MSDLHRLKDAELFDEIYKENMKLRAAIERMTRERDDARKWQSVAAELSDRLNGTPCAEIRWEQARLGLVARADAAERKVEMLRAALKDVLLDVTFMVEREIIPDIRSDIIYERARAALKETEG